MNALTVHALLVRFQKERDPRALAALFDESASELLEVACRLVSDDALAEDVLQESFVAVIESIDRFDPKRGIESGPGWLVGILGNQAKEALRRARRTPDARKLETSEPPEPIEFVARDEAGRAIRDAVDTLPARYRAVLSLALSGVTSPSAIAERLGRSAGAVRVQLHRAVGMLRAALPAGVGVGAVIAAIELDALAASRAHVLGTPIPMRLAGVGSTHAILIVSSGLLAAAAVLVVLAIVATSDSEDGVSTANVPLAGPGPDDEHAGAPSSLEPSSSQSPADSAERVDAIRAESAAKELLDLVVSKRVGIDLVDFRVVEEDRGDIVIDATRVRTSGSVRSLRVGDEAWPGDAATRPSRAARLDAIRGVDTSTFGTSDVLDLGDSAAYCLADERFGVVGISAVDLRLDRDGWRLTRVRVRRLTHHPVPLSFEIGPERGWTRMGSVYVDLDSAHPDPIGDEITAREEGLRAEIAREVDDWERAGPSLPGFAIRGCAFREHAAQVSSNGSFDYIVSTYSFESDTRDDVVGVGNDWDVGFENRNGPGIRVYLVTDDRSRVFDLGNSDPLTFEPATLSRATSTSEFASIHIGQTLLIRTLDTETDRIDLLRILAIRDDRYCVFAYRRIVDSPTIDQVIDSIDADKAKIRDVVRIQIRSGAGGGNPNQAFLDGSTSIYVQEVLAQPLDLSSPIDINENARAWIVGGVIPRGKVYRLTAIEYAASTRGDSNGPGEFQISVAGKVLAAFPESETPTAGVWRGDILLAKGDEARTYVEVRNSSQADVTFFGRLEDAP